ncbi:hypothetical protein GCM10017744_014560 [Streptomyces antimycoticus]
MLRPLWEPPREVELPAFDHAGHGGGDERMLEVLYGPVDPAAATGTAAEASTATGTAAVDASDASHRRATEEDGALALVTGLAANQSFVSGKPVATADVVTL